MPDIGIQIPPNLADWWPELVQAGATDLGGLSSNGDHISPEHPFPSPEAGARAPEGDRGGLRAPVRLPAVHDERVDRAARARRDRDQVPLASCRAAPTRRTSGDSIQRARDGEWLTPEELTAMFAESRPEVIEDMRQAADELRDELAGDLVTFVVNRNINVSNICTVGCAFCGFGVGKRSPGRLRALAGGLRAPDPRRAQRFGATEICMQSGIHPDWGLEDYLGWLRLAKETAPEIHLHAYSPMEVAHMVDVSGPDAARRLRAAARGRPGQRPRHRRRGPARRRPPADQPEQAARRALGGDHHRRPRGRPAQHRDRDVRPHRDARGAGRAHAGRARAAGPDGRLHRVRAAELHPVPDAARAARTASPRSRARRTSSTPRSSGSRWARRSRRCRPAG